MENLQHLIEWEGYLPNLILLFLVVFNPAVYTDTLFDHRLTKWVSLNVVSIILDLYAICHFF